MWLSVRGDQTVRYYSPVCHAVYTHYAVSWLGTLSTV